MTYKIYTATVSPFSGGRRFRYIGCSRWLLLAYIRARIAAILLDCETSHYWYRDDQTGQCHEAQGLQEFGIEWHITT